MSIQAVFGVISLTLLVAAAGFSVERLSFLNSAERTTGTVTDVTSYNGRCGSRKSAHNCTIFTAMTEFSARSGEKYTVGVLAGKARGHGRGREYAAVKINDPVAVVYDPAAPAKAYEDTTWGVWSTPIMIMIFQIVFLFLSFLTRNRESE